MEVERDGAMLVLYVLFFKQKTAYEIEVCSSDLPQRGKNSYTPWLSHLLVP